MEITLGVLAFLVAILAVLQGWSMFAKKNKHNPGLDIEIANRLDTIIVQLSTMEQRLNDIWDRVKDGR